MMKISGARVMLLAALVAALTAACGGGPAPPPSQVVKSVAWGPMTANYDGHSRATGTGAFQNRGSSHANLAGTYRDARADGNTVYVNVTFLYWMRTPSDPEYAYRANGVLSTPEISTADGTRSIGDLNQPLVATSSKVRGSVGVCAQFGWPVPDPCARALPTFDY
jgi:hypothetical protein